VATEFSTGAEHAGRIDTLALSEDNNPVIIEYKKVESSELVNQSLYYLAWIRDHKGDFEVAASRRLGGSLEIDWNDIRVICIAPGYKKYDIHAVKTMGANIELWSYKFYENGMLYLEEVFRTRAIGVSYSEQVNGKNPVMVAAGKKAAIARATSSYSIEEHLEGLDSHIKHIVEDLRDLIMSLGDAIEEVPKKHYIAYKTVQNFVCLEAQKKKVLLFLKIDPVKIKMPPNGRDVRKIGHYGTGDVELTIKTPEEVRSAREFIALAFDEVGG
jgi:predicted transport protein